jgi:hypothetical protein
MDAPRSRRIVLSAVATTSASSATIREATELSARTQVRVDLDVIGYSVLMHSCSVKADQGESRNSSRKIRGR